MGRTFERVPYSEIAPYKRAAKREGVFLSEGKTPIDWFIATEDGTLVGVIGLLHVTQDRGRIRGRYVLPEYRGHGIGHYLLEELLEYARERSYTVVERTTKRWQIGVENGWSITKEYGPSVGKTIELHLD